jgi:glycosyltransferase involved in cell wall biosynthesis
MNRNREIKFSIIVCAYNSVGRIVPTIEHIAALAYHEDGFEVIIVDNNSSDGTAELASATWSALRSKTCFKILMEKNQGLSYARRSGILAARGKYIVFCDDDNRLDPSYLNVAESVLDVNHEIGILGGQGLPVSDAKQLPNWFYSYAQDYAVGVQALHSGDVSARGYVWGAGFVLRRELIYYLINNNCNFLLTGRNGGLLLSGDDTEMCKWYQLAGYKLWYEEKMIFHHFIPSARLSLKYLEGLHVGFSASRRILSLYERYIMVRRLRRTRMINITQWLRYEFAFMKDRSKEKSMIIAIADQIDKH